MNLLAILEKVAPRVRLYPRWAQRLFAVTLLAVAASVGTFVAAAPGAERRGAEEELLRAVAVDVGIVSTRAHREKELTAAEVATGTADFDAPLEYTTERLGEVTTVAPVMKYLALVERGGPLPSVGGYQWWDAAAVYPTLDVKLLNESERTVFVTTADVVVERSDPDPRPVPVFHAGAKASARAFSIVNEGTPMRRVRLEFDLAPGNARPRWGGGHRHVIDLRRPDDFWVVSLDQALRREGVDVAAVQRIEAEALEHVDELQGESTPDEEALARASGPFAPLEPFLIFGTLTYATDQAGSKLHRVRFSTSSYLANTLHGIGSYYRPTGYYNVRLRTSAASYERVVAGVSQRVPPGAADRFHIVVAADTPSRHRIRLRIRFNGADPVLSGPIDLRMFVPRSMPPADQAEPVGGPSAS